MCGWYHGVSPETRIHRCINYARVISCCITWNKDTQVYKLCAGDITSYHLKQGYTGVWTMCGWYHIISPETRIHRCINYVWVISYHITWNKDTQVYKLWAGDITAYHLKQRLNRCINYGRVISWHITWNKDTQVCKLCAGDITSYHLKQRYTGI